MEGAATNDQRWAKLGDSYFARECGAALPSNSGRL